MNIFEPFAASLVGAVAKSAGQAAAQSPEVQAQLRQARTLAYIGIGAAALVFVFYFVPRFEIPGKRWRRS